MDQNNVNRDIVNPTPRNKNVTKKETFRLIAPATKHFVGRDELLEKLHHLLKSCSKKTELWDKIVVIQGLGGMGKSELARKYVEKYVDTKFIQNVAWIDSETKLSIENSFKSIASEFGLETNERTPEDVAKSVYEYFSKNFKSGLFIFDNADQLEFEDDDDDDDDEFHFGISKYLPKQKAKLPLILITSRIKNWKEAKERNNTLDVSELSDDDSVELLTTLLNLKGHEENDADIKSAIRNLARVIQGYPLGLISAAANICCDSSLNVADRIQKYITMLDVPNSEFIDYVMDQVWKPAVEKIKRMEDNEKCALTLLNTMAYFPPESTTVVNTNRVLKFEYSLLREGYSILEKHSLISLVQKKRWNGDTEIQVHPEIRRCTRKSLDGSYSDLLTIAEFTSDETQDYPIEKLEIYISKYLKQRNWPRNSLSYSIDFLWKKLCKGSSEFSELATDLSDLIENDDRELSYLFKNGERMVIETVLYISSQICTNNIKISDEDRNQWHFKYVNTFNDALKLLTNQATCQDLAISVNNAEKLKKYLCGISENSFRFGTAEILNKIVDSCRKALDDRDIGPRASILSVTYGCLTQIYRYYDDKLTASNLKTALLLHLKYYAEDSSLRQFDYWKKMVPLMACLFSLYCVQNYSKSHRDSSSTICIICRSALSCHYITVIISYLNLKSLFSHRRLHEDQLCKFKAERKDPSIATDLEKSVVSAFMDNGGPECLKHYLVLILQELEETDLGMIRFIRFLIAESEYNCADDFKETPRFLFELQQLASVILAKPKKQKSTIWHENFKAFNVSWLLLWFELFPGNRTFEDSEGEKLSLDSVAEQIEYFKALLKDKKLLMRGSGWQTLEGEMISALRPHLELSVSNPRDGWVFLTAVELMDYDIRARLSIGKMFCKQWKAEFKNKLKTGEKMPEEIWNVGKKYRFVGKSPIASLFSHGLK